jgi:tagatose 1,6-diphosphate aldolase
MTRPLSLGKLRGLQQIANPDGLFAMCAMDHRGSMQRLINAAEPERVTADQLTEYKRDVTETLAPVSSAVLLDPIFGAAQAIATGALPGSSGLLVSLEETGYERTRRAGLQRCCPAGASRRSSTWARRPSRSCSITARI